ncbi:MAG TPA: sensor histidine kinase [Conexibacter sp.]|jgi:two-component system sensor histidine kinase DesK
MLRDLRRLRPSRRVRELFDGPRPFPLSAEGGPFHDPDREESRAGQLFGVLIGLAWLAIPIATTLSSDQATWRLLLSAVLLAVAVLVYVSSVSGVAGCRPTKRVFFAVATIAAIASLLSVVVSPAWAILFTYAAVLSGIHLPPKVAGPLLLALVVLAVGINLPDGADAAFSYGLSAFGVGALMLALGRLIAANRQLASAHEQIEQLAVEAERERFARDLHDLLGHSLSVITLKAELSGRLLPDRPDEAQRHVREIEQVARAALGEVRDTVSGYRRPTLAGELAGARIALDAAGIEMRVRECDAELPTAVEALLAWTVREGTTNVIRHSGARRCEIAIEPDPAAGAARAEIRDDGRGINGGTPNGSGSGNGLDGLRERAALLAGRVEAEAVPDGGFSLRVTVPLPEVPA